MISDDNYYVVHGWMKTRLGLKGNELLVYAIIYGFSQTEGASFKGSYRYIAEWAGVSERTAVRVIDGLVSKGCLRRRKVVAEDGVNMANEYTAVTSFSRDETGSPAEKKKAVQKKEKKPPLIEREPENEMEEVEKAYLMNHYRLYAGGRVSNEMPECNWGMVRKKLKEYLGTHGKEALMRVLDAAMNDEWIVERGHTFSMILSANVFGRLLNAKPRSAGVGVGRGVDQYVDDGIDF